MVKEYFKFLRLTGYIKEVYGANTIDEMNPTKNEREDNDIWANEKVRMMKDIMTIEQVHENSIYFFDDTLLNVQRAFSAGFRNSYHVKIPGISLLIDVMILLNAQITSFNSQPGAIQYVTPPSGAAASGISQDSSLLAEADTYVSTHEDLDAQQKIIAAQEVPASALAGIKPQ